MDVVAEVADWMHECFGIEFDVAASVGHVPPPGRVRAPICTSESTQELAEGLAPCFEKLAEHRCSAADLVDRLADLTNVVDAAWPSFYHDLWMREFSS
jgi:hypothetical protein